MAAGIEAEGEETIVLVAVKESLHALRWAIDNILLQASPCCAAHTIREELENSRTKLVIEAAEKECKKRNVEVIMIEAKGDPRLKLFQLAKELKADVLVLGGHNYSGLRRLVLGSVADSCAGYAKAQALESHIVVVHQKRGNPSFVRIYHAEKRN